MYLSLKKIKHFLFILLGLLLFTFPKHFQIFKVILLVILFGIGVIETKGRIKTNKYIITWFLVYLFFAFTWSFYGIMNNNLGVIGAFRVEFIWTFVLFFFTLFVLIEKKTIIKTIYWTSFFTSLVGIYMILQPVFGSLPFLNWIPFEPVQNISGLIRVSLPNVVFMSFLFPSLLFLNTPKTKIERIFYYITLTLSFLFILFSGRRIVQIVAALFAIIFVYQNFKKINLKILSSLVLLFLITLLLIHKDIFFFINFKLYYHMYIEKLALVGTQEKRYIQMIALLKHFTQHPFIGVGFGKGIPNNIANHEEPWQYELTYFLYLYQTGLIGISIFLGLFISLFNKLNQIDLNAKAFALGLIGYLMASATDPYIISGFDYKFPILICLLYISYSELYHQQTKYE